VQQVDVTRCLLLLTLCLLFQGCSEEPRASTTKRPVRLAALQSGSLTAVSGPEVAFDAPTGWSVRGGRSGKEAVVAIVRPLRPACEVFVQVVAERGTGARELGRRRRLERLGRLDSLPVRRRVGANGDAVNAATFDAPEGLVFGGGATGPGATAVLALTSPVRRRPSVYVVAQGGTDGYACRDGDTARARELSVDVLTRIGDSIRYG